MPSRIVTLTLGLVAMLQAPAIIAGETGRPVTGNWPGWRGDGSGASAQKDLPIVWSEDQNVIWKRPLPGEGNSSPVVWSNQLFVTASADEGMKRLVICIDVGTRQVIWQKELATTEKTKTYPKSGYASATPVTDGQRVYVFFDALGLVALDMQGEVVWTRPLGPFKSPYNMNSSPILYKDMVILCCDHEAESFIVAADKEKGTVRWRTVRPTNIHYSTPLVIEANGRPQIVVNADPIIAYNPDTSEQLWSCRGMTACVTPSPVFDQGLVWLASGRNGPAMAIDPTGTGDVTETHVRMHVTSGGPYVPSPLMVSGLLMLPNDNGTIRFVDRSGNVVLEHRLKDHFSSSPVFADGKVYWTSEPGRTYVLDVSQVTSSPPSVRLLAVNELSGKSLASPAIIDGKLILRSSDALYCIGGGLSAKAPAQTQPAARSFEELKKRYDGHPAEEGEDVAIRLQMVEAMAGIDDAQAIPFLLHVARKEPHWDVCEAAARQLSRHGQNAADGLIDLLGDDRAFMRIIAAEDLGALRSPKAMSALLTAAGDRDPIVRASSLRSLALIGQADKAVDAMIAALADVDGVVKQSAIESLVLLADKAGAHRETVIAALLDCLADRNPLVVDKARKALMETYNVPPDRIAKDEILYGEQRKDSVVRYVNAGPIRMKFQDGEIRYLYVGNKEIVRRVYFAVRDSRWDTVTPKLSHVKAEQQAKGFKINFTATCRNDIADYGWAGEITGTPEGKVVFRVTGKANTDFESPRVGLNVLFGTDALAGQTFETVDESDETSAGRFPEDIAAELLIKKAKALRYTTADGMTVACEFPEGFFGMEDQRNYGDSSYKAFNSIPYEYPNVRKDRAGSQVVTIEVKNAPPAQAPKTGPVRITIGAPKTGARMPRLLAEGSNKPSGNFSNINRDRQKYTNAEVVAWSYCPALHLFDDDMYMENLSAIVDQARMVRSSAPKAKLVVNPISINVPYPRPGRDPRNMGLFAGAWSAVCIKHLATAGVDQAGCAVGPGFARQVQQELGHYAGRPLRAVEISGEEPSPIEAIAIDDAGDSPIWLINKTDQPQRVVIEGWSRELITKSLVSTKPVTAETQPAESDSTNQAGLVILAPFDVCRVTMKN